MENEQKKLIDFVNKTILQNKKISHAYLIETNGYSDYMSFIKYFLKIILNLKYENDEYMQKKITLEVDNDEYPDIKFITAEGNTIKKEQLILLEKEFSKKSMLDNKLIYVIDGAEKLNDSSANTILKFLEEPGDDIIALLVTNSRYNVIETILSRCQVLSLKNNETEIDFADEIKQFFDDLINKKKLILNFDYYLQNLFSDKKNSKQSLSDIEKILFLKIENNEDDYNRILQYILIINEEKNKLEYNVNIKLWLNDLLLKLMEVN